MRFKKYLSIVLSVLLVFAFSSCNKSDDMPERGPFGPGDYKTIEPPADGWTLEALNEVLYVNGYEVDFPFTLKDIHWDTDKYPFERSETIDDMAEYRNKDDGFRITIMVEPNANNEIDENTLIYIFSASIHNRSPEITNEYKDFIVVNGVGFGDKADKIIDQFGEWTDIENNYLFRDNNEEKTVAIVFYCSDNITENKIVNMIDIIT
jgi:hypothetical protein